MIALLRVTSYRTDLINNKMRDSAADWTIQNGEFISNNDPYRDDLTIKHCDFTGKTADLTTSTA